MTMVFLSTQITYQPSIPLSPDPGCWLLCGYPSLLLWQHVSWNPFWRGHSWSHIHDTFECLPSLTIHLAQHYRHNGNNGMSQKISWWLTHLSSTGIAHWKYLASLRGSWSFFLIRQELIAPLYIFHFHRCLQSWPVLDLGAMSGPSFLSLLLARIIDTYIKCVLPPTAGGNNHLIRASKWILP